MKRVFAASILGAVLLADMAAWTMFEALGGEPSERCYARPRDCSGQAAVLPLFRVLESRGGEAWLTRGDHRLRVVGAPSDAVVGEEVSVQGVYRADGSIGARAWRAHPGRPAKRWLGIAGLVVAILLPLLVFVPRRSERGWALEVRWPTS